MKGKKMMTRKITDTRSITLNIAIVGHIHSYCGVLEWIQVYCRDYEQAQDLPESIVDGGIILKKGIQNSEKCYMTYNRESL